jgi:DNA-binding transcriptional regulator YdaS (Cro superfamily)
MDIRKWRQDEEKSQEVVAELLGVTQAYFSKIELGRRRAGPRLARRIERITKGAVTVADLRGEP